MSCQQLRNPRIRFGTGLLMLFFGFSSAEALADRIVLRSLQIVTDRTVVSFDEEGVGLDNRQRLGWHEIEKATISPDRQAAFDKQLADLGESLYRIRQRLTTADYEGLLQPAENLYPRYAKLNGDTAYLVKQSVMWGRIAAGRREEAVEPYLHCVELLIARKSAANALPGNRKLRFDAATGLSPDLVPVWFNADAARASLPAVFKRIGEMPRPRPEGVYIYYATMALAAGDNDSATKVLGVIKSEHPTIVELRGIIDAQREASSGSPGISAAKLELLAGQMSPQYQPLAWYWLGIVKLRDPSKETRQAGLLQLIRIPAVAGPEQPELAAAALYHVMQSLAADWDVLGSTSVRRELLERYGQTYHALRLRGTSATEKKP